MNRIVAIVSVWALFAGAITAQAAAPAKDAREKEAPSHMAASAQSQASGMTSPQLGRYQLVVVPGHSGSPFLLDSSTGCVWHQVQNQETKRTTFIEVDVENLHWSWGSGAQSVLASRIDASNLTDEQKRALKENLQKTGCGLSSVVLTPGPPAQGQLPKTP